MAVALETQSRDEFILFGKVVAQTLSEADPDKQWVISLEGISQSGKSLLALAADSQLNPDRYEVSGIPAGMNVHQMLGLYAKGRTSVYFSDGLPEMFRRRVEARKWRRSIDYNKTTKLAFLSNVWNWTALSNDAKDPAAYAQNKIPVQLRINVETKGSDFAREIKLTCAEPDLEQLIKMRFEEALKLAQPTLPPLRTAPAAKPSSDV